MSEFPISYHRDPAAVLKAAMMRAATTRQQEARQTAAKAPPPPVIPPEPIIAIDPVPNFWFFIEDETPRIVRISVIQRVVADHYEMTVDDMLSPQRSQQIATARQVGIYLARKMTVQSTSQTARRFNRDHTTAIHAVRKVTSLLEQDPDLQREIDSMRRQIEDRS